MSNPQDCIHSAEKQEGPDRQPDRQRHRMVRLFSLWHRRRAGVQQNLLSDGRPGHRPDPLLALLSLTFLSAPSAVIFAHIGDRIGRKKTLVLTLSLMGSATCGSACCPPTDGGPLGAGPADYPAHYSGHGYRRRMGARCCWPMPIRAGGKASAFPSAPA
jgi:hypothetical protein